MGADDYASSVAHLTPEDLRMKRRAMIRELDEVLRQARAAEETYRAARGHYVKLLDQIRVHDGAMWDRFRGELENSGGLIGEEPTWAYRVTR